MKTSESSNLLKLFALAGVVVLGTLACGSSGADSDPSCDPNTAGTWRFHDVYLQIDASCNVTEFCDVRNDLHAVGSLTDTDITLAGITIKKYKLSGDALTLLNAGGGGEDLPFARQPSADVIPASCATK
jgi:hypothetical protein